jgi:hypothetical protein
MNQRRSQQQTLPDSLYNRFVASADELRNAIADASPMGGVSGLGITGRRITIVAPIVLDRPIYIPQAFPCIEITSLGYMPIVCDKDNIDAFVVEAPLTKFSNILLFAQDQLSTKLFRRAFLVKSTADNSRFVDVHAFGCDSLIEDEGATRCHVRDCDASTPSGRNADCVSIMGVKWSVIGNNLSGSGTGIAVRGAAGSAYCRYIGNSVDFTDIDTSASDGYNTISGNTDTNLITAHGTDDTLGGNT